MYWKYHKAAIICVLADRVFQGCGNFLLCLFTRFQIYSISAKQWICAHPVTSCVCPAILFTHKCRLVVLFFFFFFYHVSILVWESVSLLRERDGIWLCVWLCFIALVTAPLAVFMSRYYESWRVSTFFKTTAQWGATGNGGHFHSHNPIGCQLPPFLDQAVPLPLPSSDSISVLIR